LQVGLAVAMLWTLAALFATMLAPYAPLAVDVEARLQPPSVAHLWGTDELGRDVLSRVMHGGRLTIPAAVTLVAVGSLLGSAIGAVAGYAGGACDFWLMRVTELFMAVPSVVLAMAITAALGPSILNAVLALAIVWWPGYARLMRVAVMELRSSKYVEAAHSLGAPHRHVLMRTMAPNCASTWMAVATLDVGNAVLSFAGLSFLGLGPEPASPEWGRMVAAGVDLFSQWWTWVFPTLAIASLVLAFNLLGDELRDVLDPRTRAGGAFAQEPSGRSRT
jgi:peptide/nickel transport system permease protein